MESEGEIVYAIHDFEASVEDEISLRAGEQIIVLEKDELYNDGWWQGKNSRGEVGLFPMNFISYKDPNQNSAPLDRYAKLLSDSEDPGIINSANLGGRLSDPINEEAKRDSFQKSIEEEGANGYYDFREEANHSPLEPALKANASTNGSPLVHSVLDSPTLTRYNSAKIPSTITNIDVESHKRTLTNTNPLTPNRSSYRNSVRMSQMDDVHTDPSTAHPQSWNNDEVINWLERAGFQSVISLFKEHEITGDDLIKLDLNTLKDIGILAFGKRFNLNNAINSLKVKYGISSSNGPTTSNNNENYLKKSALENDPSSPSAEEEYKDDQNYPEKYKSPDSDLYPVEERKTSNLEKSLKDMSITQPAASQNGNSHSNVEKWLQQTPDFDYEHNLLKEAGISSPSDLHSIVSGGNNSRIGQPEEIEEDDSDSTPSVSSKSQNSIKDTKSKGVNGSNEYKFPAGIPKDATNFTSPPLKKQVSFSQNVPEVIGTSELQGSDYEDDDTSEGLNKKASLSASKLFGGEKRKVPQPKGKNNNDLPSNVDILPNGENATTRTYTADPVTVVESGSESSISVQGNLKKQEGAIKLWKSRYCVLNGSSLKVWDSHKLKKLKLVIDLRGYKPVLDPNLNPGKYCFKLVHQTNKAHYFCSEEAEEVRAWMKALMKMSIDRDVNAPVVTSCTVNTVPLHVARKLAPRPPSAMYGNQSEEEDS